MAAILAAACAAPVAAGDPQVTPLVTPVLPPTLPAHARQDRRDPAVRAPGTILLRLGQAGYRVQAPQPPAPAPGAGPPPPPASPPGVSSMPATITSPVSAAMPAGTSGREVQLTLRGVPFAEAVRRAGDTGRVGVRIEERPARMVGGAVTLGRAPDITLRHSGPLGRLLDSIARHAGYIWEWDAAHEQVVFARYWDREQPSPAAMQTGHDPGLWAVDPERHATLQDVLEDWAFRAGWQVTWDTERNFSVSAHARYTGAFLRAVDHLLSASELRRVLQATAHPANRWLRVREAGS